MKRLCALSVLLIVSTLFVPMQARSISTVLEKTKLTQSQTSALLQLLIHQQLINPVIKRNQSQIEGLRSQSLSLLLQLFQTTAKLDRAYTHAKTRSLVNLARNHKRSRDLESAFTIENSI